MPSTATHPTPDAIEAFALGKLELDALSRLEGHLAGCERCQDLAEAVAPDTLVQLLASAATLCSTASPDAPTSSCAAATPALLPTHAWADSAPQAPPQGDVPAALAGHPKYRVLGRLGTGGMGTVWLAEHAVMNRPVAVKVIHPDLLSRPGATARFLREVQAAARLHHPHIVTAHDAEPAGDSCLLVMEYVPGETLGDRVKAGPLPVADACRAVRDAARGLAHAHAAGLVHRDVKPHNLIQAPDGTVKVLDFGLAGVGADEAVAATGQGLTGTGMVCGTPDYIAPEQAAGPHAADARADVYGLGCTLYHLLAGRPPFPDGTVAAKLLAHRSRSPEPIPRLPAELWAVLAKMLAKRPGDRYHSADEVAAALEPFARPARSRPTVGWLVAAGLLLALIVGPAAMMVLKIERDKEVITLETNDKDIEVVLRRGGELLRVRDTKTGEEWELNALTNEIGQVNQPGGLTLKLPDREPIVLRRMGAKVVTVTRLPKPGLAKEGPAKLASGAAGRPTPLAPGGVRRFVGHQGPVLSIAISPDGKLAASGSGYPFGDGTLRIWDLASGRELSRLRDGGRKGMRSVASSPDGKRILMGGSDGVRMWDAQTGAVPWQATGHVPTVYSVAFAPDGKRFLIATGGGKGDNVIRLCDMGNLLQRLEGHTDRVLYAVFSPDGKLVLSGSADRTMRLWDAEQGKLIHTFLGHTAAVRAVAFVPGGRQVVSASEDKTVRLWDLVTGKEMRVFAGHTERINGLAVTPDGRLALSASSDRTVRVWDLASGKEVQRFAGHTEWVWAVAVTPDGRYALSGGGGLDNKGPRVKGSDFALQLWRIGDLPAGKGP
jgi:hypothetical protein